MTTPRRTRLLRAPDLRGWQRAIVREACQADVSRARDCAVVVPSRGAADQLLRTVEQQLLIDRDSPAGGAVIWPLVLTRAELYDELRQRLPDPPRRLSEMEREVMIAAAAREAVAAGTAPPFVPQAGLLAEMLAFYDDLDRCGRSVDAFERLALSDLEPDAQSDRGAERMLRQTRFMAATFRGYEARLARAGAVDERTLRRRLLEVEPATPLRQVVLTIADRAADRDGFWPADADLLARLPLLERIDVIATEAMLASGFHERLLEALPGIEDCRSDPDRRAGGGDPGPCEARSDRPVLLAPEAQPERLYFLFRDREEEIAGIARRVKRSAREAGAQGRRSPALERTAIVFRRPLPYVYLAREVLGAAGIPYQLFDALPLAVEPYAGTLDLVVEFALSGFTRRATIALFRSPHLAFQSDGHQVDAFDASGLDRALSDAGYLGGADRLRQLVEELPVPSGDRGPGVRAAARSAAAAAQELAPLERDGAPSEHLATLLDFLSRHERVPGLGAELRERHLRARSAIRAGIEALGEAHRRFDDGARPFRDLAAAIRQWIESRTFSPRAGTAGVQLLEDRVARYGDLDEVNLVGLIEGEWPERAGRNIFYPPFLLKQLGWADSRARLNGERAGFQDLLGLARRRTAVSAFELEHDAIVSPSIFLEDLPGPGMEVVRPGAVRGGRVFVREALSMEPIAPDAVTGAAAEWLALRAGARDAADERFHGRAAPYRPAAFAVRELESYGECPFRFFAERVLALDEEPADEPSRSPRERGVFVHRVLHDFFQAWGGRGRRNITPGDLDEARAVFSEVAERALARLGQAEAAIERQTLLGSAVFEGVAERVLRLEAERPEPVVARLLEHRLNGQFQLEGPAGRRAVALKGAADRIDVLQGGTFRLIDYKLGRAPDAGRALQLPLYAACVEQAGAAGHRALVLAEAGYVAFGSGKPFVPVVSEPAERDEVMREAHERAVAAVEGIERGEFPPRPVTPSLCRYCPYSAVCRKDYVVD